MRRYVMVLLGLLCVYVSVVVLTKYVFAMEFEYEDAEVHVTAGVGVVDNSIVRSGAGSVSVPVAISVADTVLADEIPVPSGVITSASSSCDWLYVLGVITLLGWSLFIWAYRELVAIGRLRE